MFTTLLSAAGGSLASGLAPKPKVSTLGEDPATGPSVPTPEAGSSVGEAVPANPQPPKVVYRGASGMPDSMTPRPGIDDVGANQGLSAYTTVEQAAKPGDKVMAIDTTKLKICAASCDPNDPTHILIAPNDGTTVSAWAATRGTGSVDAHTQDVRAASVYWGKRPK